MDRAPRTTLRDILHSTVIVRFEDSAGVTQRAALTTTQASAELPNVAAHHFQYVTDYSTP